MVCLLATLLSATVWALVNRLVFSNQKKTVSPTVTAYLIISTVAVAMMTFLAVVLAVVATE